MEPGSLHHSRKWFSNGRVVRSFAFFVTKSRPFGWIVAFPTGRLPRGPHSPGRSAGMLTPGKAPKTCSHIHGRNSQGPIPPTRATTSRSRCPVAKRALPRRAPRGSGRGLLAPGWAGRGTVGPLPTKQTFVDSTTTVAAAAVAARRILFFVNNALFLNLSHLQRASSNG